MSRIMKFTRGIDNPIRSGKQSIGGLRAKGRTAKLGVGAIAAATLLVAASATPSGAMAAACVKRAGSGTHTVCIGGVALGSSTTKGTVPFTTVSIPGVRAVFNGPSEPFDQSPISCELKSEGQLESGEGFVRETGIKYSWKNCEYQAPLNESCALLPTEYANPMVGDMSKGYVFSLESEGGTGSSFTTLKVNTRQGSKNYCPFNELTNLHGYFSQTMSEPEIEKTSHRLVGIKEETILNLGYKDWMTSEQTIELGGTSKGKSFSIIEGS